MAVHYQTYSGAEFHWAMWDEMTVLFDALSGQTHILNVDAAEVVENVATAPRTEPEIAQILADLWGRPIDEIARLTAKEVITHLTDVGLILAVPQ